MTYPQDIRAKAEAVYNEAYASLIHGRDGIAVIAAALMAERERCKDLVDALIEARTQVEILQGRLGIKDAGAGTLSIIDAALAKTNGDSHGR